MTFITFRIGKFGLSETFSTSTLDQILAQFKLSSSITDSSHELATKEVENQLSIIVQVNFVMYFS
ncbi:MAG: hypothetical protein U9Q66_02130 [Patescibacteria group bacterium]|nr:hypothetical protein [Patescibacteria group bacterium]